MQTLPIFPAMPARFAGFDVARLRQSRAYDWLLRLPMLGWMTLLATVGTIDLTRFVRGADSAGTAAFYTLGIAMRLSTVAFFVLVAASVLARQRPKGKARGVEPRISALTGTCLITVLAFFPRRELSVAAELASTLLMLVGYALSAVVLMQLSRSFSVMAEARQLVTSGIYGLVRHPLYLAEEIAVIGIAIQYWSLSTALLLAVQIGFQLRRMRNEEVVLREFFPEYTDYETKSARLIPGIY